MSDYRNPNDPQWRDRNFDSDARSMNATWGWIAAAIFVVVILGIAFGIGPEGTRTNTASNESLPPAIHMAPPGGLRAPGANPTPPAPISPAPDTPAQRNSAQPE